MCINIPNPTLHTILNTDPHTSSKTFSNFANNFPNSKLHSARILPKFKSFYFKI